MNTKRMGMLVCAAISVIAGWTPSAQALDNNGGYTIRDILVRQRWPWSQKVDVDFYLEKPAGASSLQAVSIGVVASNGAEEVSLSTESLTGTTGVLPDGCRRIVWDPTVDHAGSSFSQLKFYLSVTDTNAVAAYMVVDLDTGEIEYKGASFASEVNTDVYKTDKMAFHYIPPGQFMMLGTIDITLTKGYYIGVFEVTQAQWQKVMTTTPSTFKVDGDMRPLENVNAYFLRGAVAKQGWPTNNVVDPLSFVGQMRRITQISTFELPTEAQWEYACRAGTETYFNDGNEDAKITGTEVENNGNTNKYLNALGRYKWNGGAYWTGSAWADATSSFGPTNGTAIVGSYLPNTWGLYDMHGNVNEWCVDWYWADSNLVSGSDPLGPTKDQSSNGNMVTRGGSWWDTAVTCSSIKRGYAYNATIKVGARLVMNLP